MCGDCGALMVGEGGTSQSGKVYHYYKCVSAKKKRGCHRKAVRKDAIEELVMRKTVQSVFECNAMDSFVEHLMMWQAKENTVVPLLQREFYNEFTLVIKRETTHSIELGNSDTGNITRIDNALESLGKRIEGNKQLLDALRQQLAAAKSEMGRPFPQEQELSEKLARLNELNAQLNMDERGSEQDNSIDEEKPAPKQKLSLDERIDNVRRQRLAEEQNTAAPDKKKDQEI